MCKEMYPHQKRHLAISRVSNNTGMWWDCGTGKTRGVIEILRDKFNTTRRVIPTLILTPLVTIYNWKEEFLMYSKINKDIILVVDCNGAKRNKLIKKHIDKYPSGIIIINYEALQTKEVFNMLNEWNPEVVVGDEIHRIKNYKAQRSKLTVKLGDKASYRLGLTGTPILNSIADVWHIYRFLDHTIFGKNFFVFRSKYMIDKNSGMPKWSYFPNWVPNPLMYEEIQQKIFSIATRVTKEEAMPDLPDLVTTKRTVILGKDQAKAYNEMKEQFITFVNNERNEGKAEAVVAQLAMTKALRLLQITTGFVNTDNNNIIEFKDNPRLQAVRELLEELTPENKVILWCSFKHNYEQLGRVCKELKINHVFLTGEMNVKEKKEAMDEFRSDKECRVIIANRRAGGIGVNLVEAGYSIVYSRNFSLEDELQSESRNHRGGSQIHDKIIKINLCAKGTIDEHVIGALENKFNLSEKILDVMEEL